MRNLAYVILALAACGDNEKTIDAGLTHDATIHHDSGTDSVVGDGAAACLIPSTIGAYTKTAAAFGEEDTVPPTFVEYADSLNADPKPDQIDMLLYQSTGVFATTPLGVGTFTLTAADSIYSTCGACILLYGNVDVAAKTREGTWLASSGTLTISSLSSRIMGSLTNVTLRQVDIDPVTFVTTNDPSGCTTTIPSLSFDLAVTPDDQMPPVDAAVAFQGSRRPGGGVPLRGR